MVGATQLGFVLGVARHDTQVVDPMCKLALVPVLAHPILVVRSTELRLVATGAHTCHLTLFFHLLEGGTGFRVALATHDNFDSGSFGPRERAPRGVGSRSTGRWGIVDEATGSLGCVRVCVWVREEVTIARTGVGSCSMQHTYIHSALSSSQLRTVGRGANFSRFWPWMPGRVYAQYRHNICARVRKKIRGPLSSLETQNSETHNTVCTR